MFLPQVLKGNPFLAALLALLLGRCPQGEGPFAETGKRRSCGFRRGECCAVWQMDAAGAPVYRTK